MIKTLFSKVGWRVAAATLLLPQLVSAHVKWFAESEEVMRPYQLSDFPVRVSLVILAAILVTGFFLERKLNIPSWYKAFIQKAAPTILSLASIGFGLSFLIFSYYGFIFAPNLSAEEHVGLLALQAVAGLMILAGFYERLGGLLLIVLFALSVRAFGFSEMMDTLEMLGFAFYALIIGRPKWRITESQFISTILHGTHAYGVSIIRVTLGVNLMVLAFTEKLLAPALAQSFLAEYHWNFMQNLGFTWFTDYWFVYAAGLTEFVLGLFFVLGLVTRVCVLVLAVMLATTLYLLGPLELIGHLPHFSIAAVLLIFGASSRLHMKK